MPTGYEKKTSGVEKMKSMLKQVEAWKPPTKDHQPFKDFMVQQLTSSIGSESGRNYYAEAVVTFQATTPLDHYKNSVKKAKDEIAYHKKHWAEEVQRVKGRNTWVRKLRESLKRHSTKA